MRIIPLDRTKQIEFFNTLLPVWHAAAPQIGVTVVRVAAAQAACQEAIEAHQAARAARQASLAATLAFHNAAARLRDLGGNLVQSIKNYAEETDDPSVYTAAMIPPPRRGGGRPSATPPPAPTNPRGVIDSNGLLTVSWDAPHSGPSTGIFFILQRRIGDGPWTNAGAVSDTVFVDPSAVPAARGRNIAYRVRACRGDARSPWGRTLVVALEGTLPPPTDEALDAAA